MKVFLLAVGKLKEEYFRAAQAEYKKRLGPYCRLTIGEYKDESALLRAVPERAFVCALDERGEMMSSSEFSRGLLEHVALRGRGDPLVFAIGGADGHSEALRTRSQRLVAFGRATIAHRLVRLVLLEQIYRGFRILRGEPYHRE